MALPIFPACPIYAGIVYMTLLYGAMTNINVTIQEKPITDACPAVCAPQDPEEPCPTDIMSCMFGYVKQYGIQAEYDDTISNKYIAIDDARQICHPAARTDTRSCLMEHISYFDEPILTRGLCGFISSIDTNTVTSETTVIVTDTGGTSHTVVTNASDTAFVEKFGSDFWTVEIRDAREKKLSAVTISLAIVGSVVGATIMCGVAIWVIVRVLRE